MKESEYVLVTNKTALMAVQKLLADVLLPDGHRMEKLYKETCGNVSELLEEHFSLVPDLEDDDFGIFTSDHAHSDLDKVGQGEST